MAVGWFIFGYLCLIWFSMTHPVYTQESMTWRMWAGSWIIALVICIRKELRRVQDLQRQIDDLRRRQN